MNKIKHTALLLFVSLTVSLFFSCKRTPDRPYVRTSAIGGTLTIAELRALYQGSNIKFVQDVSLFATVTMTDNYKTLYLRDNTGCISLRQLTAHGVYPGDSLRINLNGSWLDLSGAASSLQIDSVDVSSSPTNKIVKLAVGKVVNPVQVSIAQLNNSVVNVTYPGNSVLPQSIYDAELIQINDVQFSFTDSILFIPLIPASTYINHPLYDCGGLNTITMSLFSGTADFVNKKVPHTKSGNVIGAASLYSGAMQFTPRSFNDLMLNQPRCGVDTLTQSFANCIASSNFATAIPGWYNLTQIGSLTWTGNGSAPSGFPSASNYGGGTRNVMWLISPPIQNSPTKNVNFQFEYVPYSSPTKPRQLSVLISTDFNGTNLITNPAHWTDITYLFSNLNNWSTPPTPSYFFNANNAPAMLSQINNIPGFSSYTGTFYIGFRYIGNNSTTDSTQTFAIDNFILKD